MGEWSDREKNGGSARGSSTMNPWKRRLLHLRERRRRSGSPQRQPGTPAPTDNELLFRFWRHRLAFRGLAGGCTWCTNEWRICESRICEARRLYAMYSSMKHQTPKADVLSCWCICFLFQFLKLNSRMCLYVDDVILTNNIVSWI